MTGIETEIERLIKNMNLPHFRKDCTLSNVKWLLKNMGVRNKEHPNFERAQELMLEWVRSKGVRIR